MATVITNAMLKTITERVIAELGMIEGEFNIEFKAAGGQYSNGSTGSIKLDILAVGDNGEVETREARDFKMLAFSVGLSPDDLGKTFTQQGRTFKVSGLRVKASKKPILTECKEDGKNYVFDAETVKMRLEFADRK